MTTTGSTPSDPAAVTPAKTKHSLLPSILAIVLALLGGLLIGYSFLSGILNQFDGERSPLYIVLFFVGLGAMVVGMAFALIGILGRVHRALSLIALAFSILPAYVVLVIAALLAL